MGTHETNDRLGAMLAELKRQDDELARCAAIAAARGADDEVRFVVEDLEERIGAFVEATSRVSRRVTPTRGVRV